MVDGVKLQVRSVLPDHAVRWISCFHPSRQQRDALLPEGVRPVAVRAQDREVDRGTKDGRGGGESRSKMGTIMNFEH